MATAREPRSFLRSRRSSRREAVAAPASRRRHPGIPSTPPRQSVTAARSSHRFGHANGETASSYISVPPARVSDFLIRSFSQTVPLWR